MELIVVVTIIAILTSIVAPVTSSVVSRKRKMALTKELRAAEARSGVSVSGGLPIIDSAQLDLDLESSYHRLGLEVYTRYLLRCEGQIVFRPAPGERKVKLAVPFPPLTTEAWDVRLAFVPADGSEPVEPEGVRYHQSGIYWEGDLAGEEPVTAELTFVAVGRDRFEYKLPPSHRLRSLDLTLDWGDTPSRGIPDYGLQPTSRSADGAHWQFSNLVSDRDVVLDLPGLGSASGRLLVLLRFSAVAVLLFGAGFWYMTSQAFPGKMDTFRWGHFMILAMILSVFFIAFAVIVTKGDVGLWVALPVAVAASVPLLVIHVARITTPGFALSRILPLALVSLGVVVNGVYGGALRDYVFLVLLVISVGYLTVSYRGKGMPEGGSGLPETLAA